jgi:hypothetical protein
MKNTKKKQRTGKKNIKKSKKKPFQNYTESGGVRLKKGIIDES